MKKIIKYTVKIIVWLFSGIIILIAVLALAIQLPVVKTQIVKIAEKQVNKILEADIAVGKLSGNFFTHLQLDDVSLIVLEKDTLAHISSLQVRYKLLPLLKGKILVKEVIINNPYVHLAQLQDSTWNVQYIVKPSEDDSDTSSFNMLVQIEHVLLNNGDVKIDAFDSIIPRKIQELYLDASGHYATNSQAVDLKELRFSAYKPDVQIQKLNLQFEGDKEFLRVKNLFLQTAKNTIEINGAYSLSQKEKSEINLNTQPIVLEEFAFILPKGFQLQAKPELLLNAMLEDYHLEANLQLKEDNKGINLHLISDYLLAYFLDTNAISPQYELALNIDQLNLRHWLGNPNLNYIIDGQLNADGKGLEPLTMQANLNGNFNDLTLYGKSIEKLGLDIHYMAGDANGEIEGRGSFGYIHLVPNIKQITGKRPSYQADLIAKNFNLVPLLGDTTYKSNINLNASVQGSGLDLEKITANGIIEVLPSSIMGYAIDTLFADVDFINQNIIIHSLFTEALSTNIQASGNYNLKGQSDIILNATISDASQIAEVIKLEEFETTLDLQAHLWGTIDSLQARANILVGNTRYENISLDSLSLIAEGELIGKNIEAKGNLQAHKLIANGITLDLIELDVETDTENFHLDANIDSKDIQAKVNTSVQLAENIDIALYQLDLGYKGYDWQLAKDTAFVSIGNTKYTINDFLLTSPDRDSVQIISINGEIDRVGEQNLSVELANISLEKIAGIFLPDQSIKGFLDLNIFLDGSAQLPIVQGNINIDSASLQNYHFTVFTGEIGYENHALAADINIIPQDSGQLSVKGMIPGEIRLDSMLFNVVPKETDSLNLELLIDKLPLSIINIFFPTDEINGHVDSKISFNGTLKNPDLEGNVNLVDGKLALKKYGIDYKNIQMDISVDNNFIQIDTFLVESKKGNMQATGKVEFDSQIYNSDLNTSELVVKFDKFKPIDHKQYNIELQGEVDLKAEKDSIRFSGDITIPEALVYLPVVMNLMGRTTASTIPLPLLVQELQKDSIMHQDTVIEIAQIDSLENAKPKFNFLDNLQGDLKVSIPRNTWIKNDDMRLELSGDVQLMKHREFFELFGTIDVIRGQYNLLGKVFVIQSGTVTLHGGEEIDPILNIEAVYSFRDNNRVKRDLTVIASGEISSLDIKFTYEGSDISEGDAVSYILFGMNMDALASGQQQSLNAGLDAANLAKTAAASIISSQLTKLLGNTLNVDYVEFKSNSSFDNASFVVGKYITNKLFVSYEQNIGKLEDKDVARYEMTMEYELFKFLFLQLTSSSISNGADIIFKFNSKK
jgi:translocation and assembly module TamB